MTDEMKQRITDLKTRIALESAVLMLYEAWFSVVEHFDGVAYSNEDCALILDIPVGLVRLLKEIRESVEGDYQDRAMVLYDKIHVENDHDDKQRYSHYIKCEQDFIDRWMERKTKEDEWAKQQISKEQAISDFCNVFFATFGTSVEIHEVETPEEQQGKGTEIINLIVRMVRDGVITPEIAFEYANKNNDFHDFDDFLRILDALGGVE